MSSSVGTSKCSSPACIEARARRAAHCGYSDPHRPGLQYGDSFDSLGDSPHSDRWGTGPGRCIGTGFVVNILRSFFSLLVLSQPREASQGTLRHSVEHRQHDDEIRSGRQEWETVLISMGNLYLQLLLYVLASRGSWRISRDLRFSIEMKLLLKHFTFWPLFAL